jgi:hypothetical protein
MGIRTKNEIDIFIENITHAMRNQKMKFEVFV